MISNNQLLYLSRADVESVALDMPTIISLLATAFKEKGEGRVEMPPKPGIHTQPLNPMPRLFVPIRYGIQAAHTIVDLNTY